MTEGRHDKKDRVLIIDDELDIIYIVKTGLERKGFEVDSYIEPILALQNFKRGSHRLLILEIKNPGMDGTDLRYRIKKR